MFLTEGVSALVDCILCLLGIGDVCQFGVILLQILKHCGVGRFHSVEHRVEFSEHSLVEDLVVRVLALEDSSDGLSGVSEALHLADNLVHRLDSHFGVLTEFFLRDFVEVGGNLELNPVGDFLVLDKFLVQLCKFLGILFVDGFPDVAEALVADFTEICNLLLCLVKRKLGGAQETSADVFEAENLFFVAFRTLDHPGDNLHDERNEPDEYEGVGDIEQCVERSNPVEQGCLGCRIRIGQVSLKRVRESDGGHYQSDESKERMEKDENPENSEDIEEGVGAGCSLGGSVSD